MPEIRYAFRCYHCQGITQIMQKVPDPPKATAGNPGKKIQVTKYCEHCNHPNIIEIPDWWDSSPLVLGKHADFLGYNNGVPLLQGKQP